MKRNTKKFRLALTTLTLVALLIGTPAVAMATTHNVSPGDDIQGKIDAAEAGDTIVFDLGTYSLSSTLNVNKSLTLTSADPLAAIKPIIDGGVYSLGTIIYIAADDVTLNGLEIANGTADLIKSESPSVARVTIRNCIVHGSSGDEGIQLKNSTDSLIECCVAYDVRQDGFNMAYSSGGTIRNCEVYDSRSDNAAIYVYDSYNMTVECNYIHDTQAANGVGFYKDYGGTHTIANNRIVYNRWWGGKHCYDEADGNAIWIYKPRVSSTYVVSHNTLDDNTPANSCAQPGNAIYVKKSAAGVVVDVVDNIVTNHNGYGIRTWSGAIVDYSYNDLWQNTLGATDGNPVDGGGNITPPADPLYNLDYTLQAGSPCIGAASDGKDMGVVFAECGCAVPPRKAKEGVIDNLLALPLEEIKCKGLSSLTLKYTGPNSVTNYDDKLLYNYNSGNFADSFDLTKYDLTLEYTIDMSTIASAGWSVVEVGLREVGAPNIDPNLKGGWMQSNYISSASNSNNQDLNDIHLLSKHGWLYQTYDATDPDTLVPPYWSGLNYGFWYDRDGVDSTQAIFWGAGDGSTYNTNGVYDVVINYHAISATQGTMFATINGVQQGLYVGDWKNAQPEKYPMGRSFDGDMTNMQVFFGRGGGDGYVTLSDISIERPGTEIEVIKGGSFGPDWVTNEFTILPEDGKDKLGPNTEILVNGEVVKIHTSCSKPIEVGDEFGDFTLTGLDKILEYKTYKEVEKAIEHLERSLNPDLWEDDSHLTKKGKKVFEEEKKAVHELMKIVKDGGAFAGDVQDAIDKLVGADEALAQTAIDQAIADGGDPKEIAKAKDEMAKAQEELDKGHFDKAIDHYKKAWEHACKAQKTKAHDKGPLSVSDPLKVVAYPNPIRDVNTATFQVMGTLAAEVEEIRVQIYDLSGHLVWEDAALGSELDWHTDSLSGDYLANGIYLYRVQVRIGGSWINQDIGKIAVLR